jgi:CSLREA domain-containing protein
MLLVLAFILVLGGIEDPLLTAAATVEVNSLADPGTDGCDAMECTLREAIAAAQPGDTITFAAALFVSGPGTITLTDGELLIDKDLTIEGAGRRLLVLSGNNASRVIRIAAGPVVIIVGVTITGGNLEPKGACPSDRCAGGGLFNAGTLTAAASSMKGR